MVHILRSLGDCQLCIDGGITLSHQQERKGTRDRANSNAKNKNSLYTTALYDFEVWFVKYFHYFLQHWKKKFLHYYFALHNMPKGRNTKTDQLSRKEKVSYKYYYFHI